MELVVIDPRSDPRYASELDLRFRVLREPLGFQRHQVRFAGEDDALHLVAVREARVVGCVLFDFASGRLRAMAVLPDGQRSGIGRQLVERLEHTLRLRGVRQVTLHARMPAIGFYERLGYVAEGEPFTEIGLLHQAMARVL